MGFFGDNGDKKKETAVISSPTTSYWTSVSEYVTGSMQASADTLLVTGKNATLTNHQAVAVGIGCTVSFMLGLRVGRSHPPWRRITSVNTDGSPMGVNSPWLRGKVMTVTDGDTLRFWHIPTWLHRATPTGKVSDVCLPIRLCTIDTPETAKFGNPGQPFGNDAKEFLTKMILDTTVQIQILQKDQYGRAVASVRQRGWFGWNYMDEAILKAGLAEVYLGSGAVYGPKGKDKYLQLQEMAQKKKKGMWSQQNGESASRFKARMKLEKDIQVN